MVADSAVWAEWFVAIATLGLALFTAWLVKETRRMVIQARGEISVERTALELQLEPRLMPIHDQAPEINAMENTGSEAVAEWVQPFRVPIVNLGSGIATLERAEITIDGSPPPHRVRFPTVLPSSAAGAIRGECIMSPPGVSEGFEFPPGTVFHVRVNHLGAGQRRYFVHFTWERQRGTDAWRLVMLEATGHLELPALKK